MSEQKLVPAVLRAAALLDHVAAHPNRTLSDLARALALPKSSVHALCQTLCHLSLLREEQGRFLMGGHAASWAKAQTGNLVELFNREVAADDLLGAQTVTLSVLEGPMVVYQACHASPAPLGISFRVGMRLPGPFTATGKAMLAALPEAEREAFLSAPLPPPMTRNSVTRTEVLRQDLADTAARGYSIDAGEVREGMACFGAAVLDAARRPVAAIAVSMTTSEAREEVVTAMTTALKALAARLSRQVA